MTQPKIGSKAGSVNNDYLRAVLVTKLSIFVGGWQ
jgi:hypothetical protein